MDAILGIPTTLLFDRAQRKVQAPGPDRKASQHNSERRRAQTTRRKDKRRARRRRGDRVCDRKRGLRSAPARRDRKGVSVSAHRRGKAASDSLRLLIVSRFLRRSRLTPSPRGPCSEYLFGAWTRCDPSAIEATMRASWIRASTGHMVNRRWLFFSYLLEPVL